MPENTRDGRPRFRPPGVRQERDSVGSDHSSRRRSWNESSSDGVMFHREFHVDSAEAEERRTNPQMEMEDTGTYTCHRCGGEYEEHEGRHYPATGDMDYLRSRYPRRSVPEQRFFCAMCMYDVIDCAICGQPDHVNSHVQIASYFVCASHADTYGCCTVCHRLRESSDIEQVNGRDVCTGCREHMVACDDCGTMVHERRRDEWFDIHGNSSSGCSECYERAHVRMMERNVRYTREKNRVHVPFGTEIECEFDSEPPFPRNGYHSRSAAPMPFFGGWRSEGDGSLSGYGAEVISPILSGSGGVGEVVVTMDKLRAMDNHDMNARCGGHITLTVASERVALKCQQLFTALEEAAFATVGAWGRYRNGSWCVPMKRGSGHTYSHLRENRSNTEKYLAVHNKRTCVEFRYPAGTLNASQFVINLGLCQLIVKLATNLDGKHVKSLIDQTWPMYEDMYDEAYGSMDKVHRFVLYGMSFLSDFGWRDKGAFDGVPYNPHKAPNVRVRDMNRGGDYSVQLPDAGEILDRMERQVKNFYRRMYERQGRAQRGRRDDAVADVLSVLGGEPNDRVLEIVGERVKVPNMGDLRLAADGGSPVEYSFY